MTDLCILFRCYRRANFQILKLEDATAAEQWDVVERVGKEMDIVLKKLHPHLSVRFCLFETATTTTAQAKNKDRAQVIDYFDTLLLFSGSQTWNDFL